MSNAPGHPPASVQRKLQQAIKPESADLIEALKSLSQFYGTNTLSERRALRSTIETRGRRLNEQVLGAFDSLREQVDVAEAEVDGLNSACATIAARLRSARASSAALVAQNAQLREQVQLAGRRERVARTFAAAVSLTAEEEELLNAPAGAPLALEQLLAVLARVQQMQERGRQLLANERFAQLGMQVTTQMSGYEERAYTGLYRCVHAECAALKEGAAARRASRTVTRAAMHRRDAERHLLSRALLCHPCASSHEGVSATGRGAARGRAALPRALAAAARVRAQRGAPAAEEDAGE
jgi:hypothetical protein